MALAGTLTVQDVSRSGLAPSYGAASTDGHYFKNNGRVWLHIKNTGSQVTATVTTPVNSGSGAAIADLTVTIPATTGDVMIGPFPPKDYNDSAGQVFVTFSGATGVTVAAIRVPR